MGSNYVSWGKLDAAVAAFHTFLRVATTGGKSLTDYHVIFGMGTCVRTGAAGQEFGGYTNEYVDSYPRHRIIGPIDDIIKSNAAAWDAQKNALDGDAGVALRVAYGLLVDDGYPLPGDPTRGVDRFPMPCQEPVESADTLWNVVWPHRGRHLTNLTLEPTPELSVVTGGEFRRYDYMFPRVCAVISPDLRITRL